MHFIVLHNVSYVNLLIIQLIEAQTLIFITLHVYTKPLYLNFSTCFLSEQFCLCYSALHLAILILWSLNGYAQVYTQTL